MRVLGGFSAILGAVALAIFALALADSASPTPTALAGPCGRDPYLYDNWDEEDEEGDQLEDEEWTEQRNPGTLFQNLLYVSTVPEQLPPGKPPVTIAIVAIEGHPGIITGFSKTSSDGSFYTTFSIQVDPDVPPGDYEYRVNITCHEQNEEIDMIIRVTCTAPLVAQPAGDTCPAPSNTPTTTPILTPSPTPVANASTWGDVNCDSSIDSSDALAVLHTVAGVLTPTPTPSPTATPSATPIIPGICDILMQAFVKIKQIFPQVVGAQGGLEVMRGDLDCSGAIDAMDGLIVIAQKASLEQDDVPAGCPKIGDGVDLEEVTT